MRPLISKVLGFYSAQVSPNCKQDLFVEVHIGGLTHCWRANASACISLICTSTKGRPEVFCVAAPGRQKILSSGLQLSDQCVCERAFVCVCCVCVCSVYLCISVHVCVCVCVCVCV